MKCSWFFGKGLNYLPELENEKSMQLKQQGVFDTLALLDSETVGKIKQIIHAIDSAKIEAVMDMIDPEKGEINLKIDLRVKK